MGKIYGREAFLMAIVYFSLLFSPLGNAAQEKEPPKTKLPKWTQYYYDRVALFEKENAGLREAKGRNIILLGDSLTEGFVADTYLPGYRILNRGIVADHVGMGKTGVLRRLQPSVFDCYPSDVFLMIGVNDLGDDCSTASIRRVASCYREVCRTIRSQAPGVNLYLESCLPTSKKYVRLNPAIRALNGQIRQIAADLDLTYIDLHALMVDEKGELKKEFTREGLHLTPAAYKVWAKALEPYLPSTMGTKRTGMPSSR